MKNSAKPSSLLDTEQRLSLLVGVIYKETIPKWRQAETLTNSIMFLVGRKTREIETESEFDLLFHL